MKAAARPARTGSLPAALALTIIALAPTASAARIFIGSWGDAAGSGRVFEYDSGLTWNEISPTGGLGREVWDLAFIDSRLYAAVGIGDDAGALYSWDGAVWTNRGDFAGPLTWIGDILVPHDLSQGRCAVMRRARIPGGRIGQAGPPRRPPHR